MNQEYEEDEKFIERRDYVVLAIPWLAALVYWRVLAATRHLEDIGTPLIVLTLGAFAALIALGVGLYGARGRRLRLALAWTVSTLGAWACLELVLGSVFP
ncbi:MAG: hypothetical protein JF614_30735 [Acidobacteria bacterium]|nr:hypothetical protein [Acidobacteriota bacterium]